MDEILGVDVLNTTDLMKKESVSRDEGLFTLLWGINGISFTHFEHHLW